jgi:phage-related protein
MGTMTSFWVKKYGYGIKYEVPVASDTKISNVKEFVASRKSELKQLGVEIIPEPKHLTIKSKFVVGNHDTVFSKVLGIASVIENKFLTS